MGGERASGGFCAKTKSIAERYSTGFPCFECLHWRQPTTPLATKRRGALRGSGMFGVTGEEAACGAQEKVRSRFNELHRTEGRIWQRPPVSDAAQKTSSKGDKSDLSEISNMNDLRFRNGGGKERFFRRSLSDFCHASRIRLIFGSSTWRNSILSTITIVVPESLHRTRFGSPQSIIIEGDSPPTPTSRGSKRF